MKNYMGVGGACFCSATLGSRLIRAKTQVPIELDNEMRSCIGGSTFANGLYNVIIDRFSLATD